MPENPHTQNRFKPLGDKARELQEPDAGIHAKPQPKAMTARQAQRQSFTGDKWLNRSREARRQARFDRSPLED